MDDFTVFLVDAEVGATDHGPGAHSALVKTGVCESGQASLGLPKRHSAADWVPQERGDVVLGLAEHRLWVDRHMARAGGEDVVVVEVAVDERRAPGLQRRVELVREPEKIQMAVRVGRAGPAYVALRRDPEDFITDSTTGSDATPS